MPIAIALPTLARTFWIASVWIARQGDVDALVETLRGIAPGSAVITLQQEPADWRTAPTGRFMIGAPNGVRATGRHLGALAVIGVLALLCLHPGLRTLAAYLAPVLVTAVLTASVARAARAARRP